jgi:hypothetical protein
MKNRIIEQASTPTPLGDEAGTPGTPMTSPSTPGFTEAAGDSSKWLIAARAQMAERSPLNLDVRSALLVYAAKLKPSWEPPKPKFGPIWQYWHSGLQNAPDICQTCYASIKLHAHGREIIFLDDNSIDRYIRLPPHVVAKREKITPVHFADIVLAYLLVEHGGTWMDTTVFLTGSIDHITADVPFFAFSRPNDPQVLSSWFMHSAAGHPLMFAMRDMLTDYWKDNETVADYNYFHYLFECAITLHAELCQAWRAAPYLLSGHHGFPRQLQDALKAGLSQSVFEEICRRTPVHKLSWKLPKAALAEAKKLPEFARSFQIDPR